MSIEKEIRDYLSAPLRKLDTTSRDIDLIVYYYGLNENLWPTLEEAAIRFDVGESKGRRTERPRQIINEKFKKIVELSNLPSLKKFAEYLNSSDLHTYSKLIEYVKTHNFFDENINQISLLRLLHDIGHCKKYRAYTTNLDELKRTALNIDREVFITNDSSIKELRIAYKKAKTIPGRLGIAKLEYLHDEPAIRKVDIAFLISLVKRNSNSWFFIYGGEQYYLFESRDNTLINSLEKARNIASHEDVEILTKILGNSLKRRTVPKKRKYPPNKVIRQYLVSSKYTKMHETTIALNVEKESLTDIERDVVEYMSDNEVHDFTSISAHLDLKGYSKPLIDKAVLYSPLIYVDKSEGRGHYKYHLVGVGGAPQSFNLDRYETFMQRLIQASIEGTDGSHNAIIRKEQHILSEWLFKDKEYEECAICKRVYSVNSLITAHKKKRSECAENERTDPNIVMPLCAFGCDYLYEKRLIYIDSGHVVVSKKLPKGLHSEIDIINNLNGKKLDSRWTERSEQYFTKPD